MRVKRLVGSQVIENEKINIDISLLDKLIEKYKGKKGNLIPLLQGAQAIYGYLPNEVFEQYSKQLGLKLSDMYGVATFYSQFRLKKAGKHIVKVCHGTACHVQNADAITDAIKETLNISDGETTPDGMFTLESVACLGCCSLAPVMMIGDNTFGKLKSTDAVKVIREIKLQEAN
jgi:NADH-quinone oxidoreductase subunit E